MRRLLEQENYRALNVQLQLLQAKATATPEHEADLFTAYQAFDYRTPEKRKLLDRWVLATPDTHQPYLARAFYLYGMAWAARGGAWASETEQTQRDAMQHYYADTRRDIDAAIAHGADSVAPHFLSLGMWLSSSRGDEEAPS